MGGRRTGMKTALIRFLLFVVCHVLWFRMGKVKEPVRVLILSFLLVGVLTGWLEWGILSWFVYALLVIAYILGIFGMMMASLRVRILSLIVKEGGRGITLPAILKIYNRDKIIKNRLARLVGSRDVYLRNNKYHLQKQFSLFLIHGSIFALLKKLYGFK